MTALSARDAKHDVVPLIDLARAQPVVVEKHGRPAVLVLTVEANEKLTGNKVAPSRLEGEE